MRSELSDVLLAPALNGWDVHVGVGTVFTTRPQARHRSMMIGGVDLISIVVTAVRIADLVITVSVMAGGRYARIC